MKPYALSNGSPRSTTSGWIGDFDGGLDVKYGVTTGLRWDFTVNTDFSQVEADEQQVNLTRFNLFFPEKRDFFLENQGIFHFVRPWTGGGGGGGEPSDGRQNSRRTCGCSSRVALASPTPASRFPILAGTRLTGRAGRLLDGGAEHPAARGIGPVPATNFTPFRLRRDILANSDIGAMLLNKEENGPQFNRLAGAGRQFPLRARERERICGEVVFAGKATAAKRQRGRGTGTSNYQRAGMADDATLHTIGDAFNDELGFVPRVGVDTCRSSAVRCGRSGCHAGHSRDPAALAVRHCIQPPGRRRPRSRQQDFHLPLNFHNSSFMELGVNTNVEVIRRPSSSTRARGVRVDPGRYSFNEYFALWNTNARPAVSVSLPVLDGQLLRRPPQRLRRSVRRSG